MKIQQEEIPALDHPEFDSNMDLLVGEDKVTITVRDEQSRELIVEIELTPQQFCQLLSRHVHVKCVAQKGNLDRIGKKLVMDELIFEIPEYKDTREEKEIAIKEVEKICPKGWIPDLYFNSKGSFFTKDKKRYAKTTVRRWE